MNLKVGAAVTANLRLVRQVGKGGMGSVWVAYHHYYGQLGNGTNVDSPAPVTVAFQDMSTVQSVASGSNQSCTVLTSGEAECWGRNNWGQLGGGAPQRR